MNIILRCICLYYALPSLVFLWGWYEPWVSLPLIAVVVWGCCMAESSVGAPSFKGRQAALFTACALLLVLQQWLTGYTGHFPQHPDFCARNAMYGSLCREAWPMASPEGCPFVYYAAAWLPSALLVKIAPAVDAGWAFMIQNALALIAAFFLLCCRLRKVSLWLILGSICLSDYPSTLTRAYMFIKETGWGSSYYSSILVPRWLDLGQQTSSTINHAPYLILAMSLLLLPMKRRSTYVLIGACMLPISPLGAIGAFPFVIWRFLQGGLRLKQALKEPILWGAGLIVGVVALFYAQTEVSQSTLAFIWQMPGIEQDWVKVCLVAGFNIVLFGVVFLPFCYKKMEFHLAYALFAALPLVFYGHNYNELIFKASAVCYVVFVALLPELFATKGLKLSKSLVYLMLFHCVLSTAQENYKRCLSFGDKETNIRDPYNSDYYGESAVADRKKEEGYLPFPTKDAPARILVPYILKPPPRGGDI